MSEEEKVFWLIVAGLFMTGLTGAISYQCGKQANATAEQCWEIGTDTGDKTRLYRRGEAIAYGSLHVDAADALAFARKAGYVLCATVGSTQLDGGK